MPDKSIRRRVLSQLSQAARLVSRRLIDVCDVEQRLNRGVGPEARQSSIPKATISFHVAYVEVLGGGEMPLKQQSPVVWRQAACFQFPVRRLGCPEPSGAAYACCHSRPRD